MPNFRDRTGDRCGSLLIERQGPHSPTEQIQWHCRCDCGATILVRAANLHENVGGTKTCGCSREERRQKKHGMERSPEYNTWKLMKRRCRSPSCRTYRHYGGRGIEVCDVWANDFAAFYADMGPKPSAKHSIERKDNGLGYCKDNCVWATAKEQVRNRRKTLCLTYKGRTQALASWAEEFNMNYFRLKGRIRRGWTVEEALTRV